MRRLDMSKVKEILRLKFDAGLSLRDIAASCNCGKSTVDDVLRRAQNAKISCPYDLNDKELLYIVLLWLFLELKGKLADGLAAISYNENSTILLWRY